MPRIYYPLSNPDDTIRITGEKARYLATVLRCKKGDDLVIFNGKGKSFKTVIEQITTKEVIAGLKGIEDYDTGSEHNLILLQGILKGEKMDLVVQKTTELGVSEIIPTATDRSVLKDTRKTTRWKKIAEEASRQCGRETVPIIRELTNFDKAARGYIPDNRETGGIMFWEEGGISLKSALEKMRGFRRIIIAIGPEGGFTKHEADVAASNNFIVASLGKRILRAETAAITATGIIQFMHGDMD